MSASTSSLQSKPTWEDDAWKSDSDDDEFVKTSRIGSTSSTSLFTNGSGSQKTKATGGTARHAPPARPHPYPFSLDQTASSSREGSSLPKVQVVSAERPSISSTNTSTTQSGWTLIERTGSRGSLSASVSPTGKDNTSLPGPEEADAKISSGKVPHMRRDSETEAKAMIGSIRDDLDEVLRDPTEMLNRLSLKSSSRTKPSRASSQNDLDTSIQSDAGSSKAADLVAPLATANVSQLQDTIPIVTYEIVAIAEGLLERKSSVRTMRRKAKFIDCLGEDVVQMDKLRALAWAGVPDEMRPMIWMLLLGHLPPAKSARASTLARKRAEYQAGVRLAFQRGSESLDQAIWHQIHIDVPRTNPGIALWQRQATQRALERILYVWAIRHPASGYVQGINDLATPFFQVFLGAYISSDVEHYDVALLPPAVLEALEADTFWCLSKLLDGIQDNYIFAQPGIQRQVRRMGELVGRINPPLHSHLEGQGVEYIQFAFRWMNCLLMRELSVRNIVRMWDTYLAEGPDAFSDFHLYVCSSFLNRWDEDLRKMDFQGIIMFLQSLPTQKWTAQETELLLADAFVKKSLFGGTAHLTN